MENIDNILRSYGSANEDISAWINNYKEDQKRSFKGMSFPTRRDEDWKYTNVSAVGKLDFKLPKVPGTVNTELLNEIVVKDFSNLVFIDGVFSEKLSNINKTSGIVVVPLKEGKLKHETQIR